METEANAIQSEHGDLEKRAYELGRWAAGQGQPQNADPFLNSSFACAGLSNHWQDGWHDENAGKSAP
jgi:hypothetical protein